MFVLQRIMLRNNKIPRRYLSQTKSQDSSKSAATNFINKVLDNPLPLGVGALVVGLLQWKRIQARNREQQPQPPDGEQQPLDDDDYVVKIYKSLPLRHISRLWGKIHDIYLPVWARNFVIGSYVKITGCDISEAENEDLTAYQNLGAFFKRKLKCDCRPIDSCVPLVSPCDGQVLYFGQVDPDSGLVHQVKGVSYSLRKFVGCYPDGSSPHTKPPTTKQSLEKSGNKLYECVMYLAPKDYHRFHSPVNWTLHQRRHFPGELLSVNPSVVRKMNKVFELNERAVYLGEWEHGFFSMTAVGATMVGAIKVECDPDLATNNWKLEEKTFYQKIFQDGVKIEKGAPFGEFNLGSTIVLIFEAPEDFTWNLHGEDVVKVGMPLCSHVNQNQEAVMEENKNVNESS